MKKFFVIAVILVLFQFQNCAKAENEYLTQEMLNTEQENELTLGEFASPVDDDKDDVPDSVESEFRVFDELGKNPAPKEETFLQRILKTKITRTDIPSYLLKDELTFTHKYGKTEFYAGHRGSLSSFFAPHHYTTNYDDLATEFGFQGTTQNNRYDYRFSILPIVDHGKNYVDYMWGDLFITDNIIPHHKIQVGRSRGQVGIEGGMSTYTLPFVQRSQIARNFGNLRTTSIKLIGNYNYADYSLSVGSSGRYFTSGMPGADFIGWLNVKPFGSDDGKLGRLTVGGGLNSGHNRFNYNVGTIYIGYKHKRLWTNFEAAIADGYNGGAALSNKKASGMAYTLGLKLNPHLQVIARVDHFDPNRKVSHNSIQEYTAGINWFIRGQALRFVLNYVYCKNQATKDSHKIFLGTQILL